MVDYLAHHGVKGMHWGVRRKYASYSGTYTKAGVKRFNESAQKYDSLKADYKKNRKQNTSYDNKMAKAKIKQAKSNMEKDYDHLKYDKLGDEGKIRYKKGQRIRPNKRLSRSLKSVGGAVVFGTAYAHNQGLISNKKVTAALMAGGAVTAGAGFVNSAIHKKSNKQLSAYYSHTSNYK